MRVLTGILLLSFLSLPVLADEQRDLSSQQASEAKSEFNKTLVKDCFTTELNMFESVRDRLPNEDEADLLIDACMKKGNS